MAEEYEYYQVLGGARINIYAFIHQPDGLRNMRATPLGRRHTMTPFPIYESKTHSIRRHKEQNDGRENDLLLQADRPSSPCASGDAQRTSTNVYITKVRNKIIWL